MRLVVDDIWAYIHSSTTAHFGVIDSVTSYVQKGKWFSQKYRNGQWDGRKKFREFDRSAKLYRFPAGLLDRVVEALDAAKMVYEIDDRRCLMTPDPVYTLPSGFTLRPYQREAHDALIARGRGVVKVPTAGGKTGILASIIQAHNLPTLWMTDRRVLLYQSKAFLEKNLQCPIGILGDQEEDIKPITVAMVQTLVSRLDSLKSKLTKFQVLVLDEAHHAQANTWFESICNVPAPYRYGATATPTITGDGLRLLGVCGGILYEISPQELISQGYMTKPQIWFAKVLVDKKLTGKIPHATIYRECIVENQVRNELATEIAWKLARECSPTLTLVNQINHGKILHHLFTKAGVKTEFIYREVDNAEREDILGKLQDRKLDNVIGITSILGEGMDACRIENCINACGTTGSGTNMEEGVEPSGRVILQALGRILRIAEGKTKAEFFDFSDSAHKSLVKATKLRLEAFENEGYSESIKFYSERK